MIIYSWKRRRRKKKKREQYDWLLQNNFYFKYIWIINIYLRLIYLLEL